MLAAAFVSYAELWSRLVANRHLSLVNYSRLVMFSFGFQQAYHRGIKPGDHSDQVFFTKVSSSCLTTLRRA